jgi:hypothetical protein
VIFAENWYEDLRFESLGFCKLALIVVSRSASNNGTRPFTQRTFDSHLQALAPHLARMPRGNVAEFFPKSTIPWRVLYVRENCYTPGLLGEPDPRG